MNLSRCYQGFVNGKDTLMDREAVENLSRRNPETSMDRDCDKVYREKKKEGLDVVHEMHSMRFMKSIFIHLHFCRQ